jgi:hypothetical protein
MQRAKLKTSKFPGLVFFMYFSLNSSVTYVTYITERKIV